MVVWFAILPCRKGYLKWYKEKLVIQWGSWKVLQNFFSNFFVLFCFCFLIATIYGVKIFKVTKWRVKGEGFWNFLSFAIASGFYNFRSAVQKYDHEEMTIFSMRLCLQNKISRLKMWLFFLRVVFFPIILFSKISPFLNYNMVTDWVIWYKVFFSSSVLYICGFNRTRAIIQLYYAFSCWNCIRL